MIIDSFDARTLANMEVALERACETLGRDSELHQVRSRVAVKIVECADSGGRTLGALTDAGRVAATEFLAARHDTTREEPHIRYSFSRATSDDSVPRTTA